MKKITLLFLILSISLGSICQTIYDFDTASKGVATGEYAIYKGNRQPVYITSKGKKFINITNKEGKPSKKYIPTSKKL